MSDEDYDYGDDDFEDDFENSGKLDAAVSKHGGTEKAHSDRRAHGQQHAASATHTSAHHEGITAKKEASPRATSSYSDNYDPNDDEDAENQTDLLAQLGGEVDLESYLKNMLASPPAANEENDGDDDDDEESNVVAANSTNKELQPLIGVQPEDEEQRKLQLKLGYSPEKKPPLVLESSSPNGVIRNSQQGQFSTAVLLSQPNASLMTPSAIMQHFQQQQQQRKGSGQPPDITGSSNSGDHVSQLLAMAGASKSPPKAAGASDVENALKVDALLRDLFPSRYKDKETPVAPIEKPKKKKKQATSSSGKSQQQQQYGLGAPRLSRPVDEDDVDDENDCDDRGDVPARSAHRDGGDLLGGLDSQLKLLKKELKNKDEKIQRLTEHSMMMGNQMDKLRGEVARLNARLHEAQMELEAKEARLVEVMRKKKKENSKKKHQQQDAGDQLGQNGAYEAEILRWREREQALMDAVEELSSQNEDLIVKLRESMQRELEL
jgi:hypothetical protein